jgi:hypothetical protein
MSRIIGFVAGFLLLGLLLMVWLPVPNETKLISIIYLWVILAIFSGAVAVVSLPGRLLKVVSGLMTVAIIVWVIAYLPQIIRTYLS